MSNEVGMFGGNSLVSSDLFKKLQGLNDNLSGGSVGGAKNRRISLRGGKFRQVVNGEELRVSKNDSMEIVIIDAAKIARTYYEGTYDPKAVSAPTCWSSDTNTPADEVPDDQRQADRCMDCPQNVKGSGMGNGRACRFSQRLAIAFPQKMDEVYQLQLPATSIFGEAKDNKMPMQAYAKFLAANNALAIAVVTEMYFDENSEVPKLFFKPVRPLTEEELEKAVEMREHQDTKRAVTMTVAQTDGVQKVEVKEAPKPAVKPRANAIEVEEPEPEVEVEAAEEVVSEPKKVRKKAEPAPADDADLADIVDSLWDE
jgi:hypothetical protein